MPDLSSPGPSLEGGETVGALQVDFYALKPPSSQVGTVKVGISQTATTDGTTEIFHWKNNAGTAEFGLYAKNFDYGTIHGLNSASASIGSVLSWNGSVFVADKVTAQVGSYVPTLVSATSPTSGTYISAAAKTLAGLTPTATIYALSADWTGATSGAGSGSSVIGLYVSPPGSAATFTDPIGDTGVYMNGGSTSGNSWFFYGNTVTATAGSPHPGSYWTRWGASVWDGSAAQDMTLFLNYANFGSGGQPTTGEFDFFLGTTTQKVSALMISRTTTVYNAYWVVQANGVIAASQSYFAAGLTSAPSAILGSDANKLLQLGSQDFSGVNLQAKANTAATVIINDGTNNYLTVDTRTGVSGVAAFTFVPGTAPSFASASGSSYNSVKWGPWTLGLTGGVNVTALHGLQGYFDIPTVNNGNATIASASTVYIKGAPANGTGTGTITNPYGLYLDNAAVLGTSGPINTLIAQTTLNGTTAGTVVWSQPFQGGSFKAMLLYFNGYENNSSVSQVITATVAWSFSPMVISSVAGLTVTATSTTITIVAPNNTTLYSGWVLITGY